MTDPDLVVERVHGQGPFVEIGDPTAVATSSSLVVVAGGLGHPQWNGHDVSSRSDRTIGWHPVGLYDAHALRCLGVLTTRWQANDLAIHPTRPVVAIATGSYDGGYLFEGELLVHDLDTATTTVVLAGRCVERVSWRDARTLDLVLAPVADEAFESWDDVPYEPATVTWPDDDLPGGSRAGRLEVVSDLNARSERARRQVTDLARSVGDETWALRRHAWAVAAAPGGGVVVGLRGAIECWARAANPRWRIPLAGTCTQLISRDGRRALAAVWSEPGPGHAARVTTVLDIDLDTGDHHTVLTPGHAAVVTTRADAAALVRDTRHGPSPRPAIAIEPRGEIAEVEVGPYDVFNHYLDVRRARQLLVLVGRGVQPHEDKWIAEVRRDDNDPWTTRPLFPLSWTDQHVFGGPAVYLDDDAGPAIVHAGAIHDGRGLLPGNAFVVRRRWPDGEVAWEHRLDTEVTALDERDGRLVVVTNVGRLVVLDTRSGEVFLEGDLRVAGHLVVPLSLTLLEPDLAAVGTLDGRVVEVRLG